MLSMDSEEVTPAMLRVRPTLALSLPLALSLCGAGLLAQSHHHRPRPAPSTGPTRPPTIVAPPLISDTGVAPSAAPRLDTAETIPVPVSAVDGMLRRMRVYLLLPPNGVDVYGLRALGPGRRLWVLLPTCRTSDPDDPRDPCPVERATLEAIGMGNVASGTPTFTNGTQDSRRVQSFVVANNVPRVRIKVWGTNNHLRYEAVIETERLVDLPYPLGTATATGFEFDYTQYPAR